MRRFFVLLFFVLIACLAQTSEARKLALLVGVNEYDNISPLKCCVNDMKALKAALVNIGFVESDIIILTTGGSIHQMPTKEKIEQKVAEILAAAKPDDIVFFAFSGHGAHENAIDYFCPPFAKTDNLEGTCVSITKVMDDLSKSEARFKWMVVDACRSNSNSRDAKGFQVIPVPPAGIALFQSCNKGEFSYEEKRADGNGFFTKNLVAALSGKADSNQDGNLTLFEVCTWTATQTKAEVEKMENKTQNPFLNLSAADFTLSENPNIVKAYALVAEAHKAMDAEDYELAIKKYDEAIALHPQESWINERKSAQKLLDPPSPINRKNIIVPDDFATIAEAYKIVKDNGFITIQPGKYELAETIVVDRTVTFRSSTGRADDVIIECQSADAFKITGGSASFQNISVISKAEISAAFDITGGTAKLFRCVITSRKSSGMFVRGENANPQVESCTIKNCNGAGAFVYDKGLGSFNDCEIYGNECSGFQIKEAGNPTVTDCKIHDGKANGIIVYNNGLGKFSNCEIYGNANSGINVSDSGNPTVTGCKIHDGKGIGVYVYKNGLGKFNDCEIYGNTLAGIQVCESGNPTFTGCKIHDGKSSGVCVKKNGLGSFSDCEIYGNESAEIIVNESGNPTVTGCKIYDGKASGVYVETNGLGKFNDCEIYGNALAGIQVSESGNPTVTGCKIFDGKSSGVCVVDSGLGKFNDCEIYGNALAGIHVSGAGNPTVTGCKIHDGKGGGVYVFKKGMGTFNKNTLEKNYWNGKLDNWTITSDAGEVKGSENTPPIPER